MKKQSASSQRKATVKKTPNPDRIAAIKRGVAEAEAGKVVSIDLWMI